jgi:putative DNA primase/helicase
MPTDDPVDRVVAALETAGCRPRANGNGWRARCPAHAGRDADSLSVAEGSDGRVLLTCHSKGCTFTEIMAALGFEAADGFPRSVTVQGLEVQARSEPVAITATYPYTDAEGQLVFEVVRLEPKGFRQRRPDGAGGWTYNLKGIDRRPLYRLSEVLGADLVLVPEGEKDCDNLAALGFHATTSAQGAGSAHKSDWSPLAGKRVVILPDNDEDGAKYRDTVAELVTAAGAAEVRVLVLPGLAPKGDASDWLAAGHGREKLEALLAVAPEWVPAGRPAELSLSDICAAEYPEPRWAVPGLYPEGLVLLCGKPKIGKSWQCLDLALAVAAGGYFLGKIKVERGEVLYLALEDSPRRVKSRVAALLAPGDTVPSGCSVLFQAPRLGDGLEEYLAAWLQKHPNARAVIIDTLARVRPKNTNRKDWYLEDTEQLAPLQRLALDHGVMILAAGHLRKSASDDPVDLVSGSVGLTGVADTVAVLTRSRGRADGELFITGRDIEERTLALTKQGPQWVLEGDTEEYRMSETRSAARRALDEAGNEGLHYRDLAEALRLTANNAKVLLKRMADDGQAIRAGGGFYVSVTCNQSNQSNQIPHDGYTVTAVTPVTADTAVTHTPTLLPTDLTRSPAEGREQASKLSATSSQEDTDGSKPEQVENRSGTGTGTGDGSVVRTPEGSDGSHHGTPSKPAGVSEYPSGQTGLPKAKRPELPEHSRDWPKPFQKRLREVMGQRGCSREHATEIVRKEFAEGRLSPETGRLLETPTADANARGEL